MIDVVVKTSKVPRDQLRKPFRFFSAAVIVANLGFVMVGASAEAAPNFSKGAAIFQLKDSAGRTPTFRIFGDSPKKQALAMAVIAAINAEPEVQPKLPVKKYIDLRIESLTLTPRRGLDGERLAIQLRVSGHDLDLPDDVSREDFMAGRTITASFPTSSKDLAVFTIQSQGELKFRLDRKSGDIIIENASGRLKHDSFLTGQGEEKIRFTGKGILENQHSG